MKIPRLEGRGDVLDSELQEQDENWESGQKSQRKTVVS